MKNGKFMTAIVLALALAPLLSAAPASKTQSFILKEGADFWNLKGDKMEWVEALSLGQTLDASASPAKGKYKGKDGIEREYNLVKVQLDSGKSGYVIEYYVARDAVVGVITSDLATLYNDARDTAVSQTIIPPANIVALWPVAGKPDFYKAAGWEEQKGYGFKDKFLAASDVSTDERDINVALLLKAMAGMRKIEQKKKILSTIDAKYPNSAFEAQVEKAREDMNAPASAPASNAPAAAMATVKAVQNWVASAALNIRKEPNTGAEVVTVLNKGDACATSEYSNEVFTVGDKAGRWYRTTQPAQGWAFGAFLEPAPKN